MPPGSGAHPSASYRRLRDRHAVVLREVVLGLTRPRPGCWAASRSWRTCFGRPLMVMPNATTTGWCPTASCGAP